MKPSLSADDRAQIIKLYRSLKQGDNLSQSALDSLVAEWEPRAQPSAKEKGENFAIALPDGTTTGVVAPRWAFHLFGLRHRAMEIALKTETGLILLQRRSPLVQDYPNAPDMAVAGHIPQNPDGSDMTFLEGAWKEMEEEIGLSRDDAEANLLEGELLPVGSPYLSLDVAMERTPPFFNTEVRQIFAATLTADGLSRLRFPDNEVSGLLFVNWETAWSMLENESIASGMRYSLPRYLDWLAQTGRL